MSEIETVIFDLGNVLINWDPRNLYRKIFSDSEKMEYFIGNVCTGKWNAEQDRGRSFESAIQLKQKEYPAFKQEISDYYYRWPEMLGAAITGTVEILKKLHTNRSLRLYALTNWSAQTFPYAVENFDFLKIFEGILVSGREALIKPDLAIYKLLLKRFDIEAEAAVFIDDSLANVEAAQKLGIHALHFKDSESLVADLQNKGITF